MTVTHTFKIKQAPERLVQQAAIHRRCILLLRAARAERQTP